MHIHSRKTRTHTHIATGISWSPLRGVKGVKPPMEFGDDSGLFSWPCRKKGPHLAMMGASRGFSPAAAPVSDFSRGTTGSSESLSCGARDVRSPCVWWRGVRDCSRVIVGNRASRRIEERLLRSFSGCGREPWVPLICVGDLRQLLSLLPNNLNSLTQALKFYFLQFKGKKLEALHTIYTKHRFSKSQTFANIGI